MTPRRALGWAAGLNAAMAGVEGAAALATRSVALAADAVDFVEDAAVYLVALLAEGWSARARALAAFATAGLMAVPGLAAAAQFAGQLLAPQPPHPVAVGGVAAAALAVNLASAALILRGRRGDARARNVTLRAAWLSSRNDALANLAMIGGAGLVAATASPWPDMLVGAGVAALHLSGAGAIVAEARLAWRERTP